VILGLERAGQFEAALGTVRDALSQLLGGRLAMLERLEASSAVEVVGPAPARMYAALVGEEGLIHNARRD